MGDIAERVRALLKNKVTGSAAWLMAGVIARAVLTLCVTMLTARYLGPANYGLIGYAASTIGFVLPVARLGLGNTQVHELVNSPAEEGCTLGTSFLLIFAASAVCMTGVYVYVSAAYASEPVALTVCFLYSMVLPLGSGAEIIKCWFQTKYLVRQIVAAELTAYLLISVYKVLLLASGKNVCWFAVSDALEAAMFLGAAAWLYRKHGGQKLGFSWEHAGAMLNRSRYYMLPNLFGAMFQQTDKIMLKGMLGNSAVGYYTAAAAVASLGTIFIGPIANAARPHIFESFKIDHKRFEKELSKLYCVAIYFSLALSTGVFFLSVVFIRLAFGEAYLSAVPVLRAIIWFSVFSNVGVVNEIWIVAESRQKTLIYILGIGAFANIAVNFLLIPIWGSVGAAVATLLTQFVSNVIVVALLKPTRPMLRIMARGLDPRRLLS